MSHESATAAQPRRSRGTLGAILRKDVMFLARDWLFIGITIASMSIFIVLYFVLPAEVDDSFALAVRGRELAPALEQAALAQSEGEPLGIRYFDERSDLAESVASGESEIGIDFPEGFMAAAQARQPQTVRVYTRPSLPQEVSGAISTMVREIALALAGDELPVESPAEEDALVGPAIGPVPLRDQLKPLYAFLILIMESIALATLIASEIQQRTATAILATPASVTDLVLSKTLLGTLIAFSEATIVMVVIRGLGPHPGIVLVTLLLGACMVTGLSMIAGSAGRDLVGTMLLGILFLVPLAIPAFATVFPGSAQGWITVLPTYGLVNAIVESTVRGGGWIEVGGDLLALAAWGAAFLLLGVLILKKRMATI